MRLHTIMLKTLKDLFSVRRTLSFIIALISIPFFGSMIFASGAGLSSMTLAMQNQMIMGFFIILSFIWIAGVPLVLLAGVTCGDFISKEDQDGTLLLLVSKPVRRYEIILGKFLAFMLSTVLLELTALLLSTLIISTAMGIDMYIFNNMLSLAPYIFLYSVLVAFVFGAVSTALSSLFRSRIKTIMTMVGVTILIFFGFMVVRGWLEVGGIYEEYGLNNMDINYHLGNSYLLFTQASGFRMAPIFQGIMGQFTGTYDAADMGKLYDMDIGAMTPSLEPKSYNTPAASLLIWVCIAVVILLLGMMKFERREVS